MKKAIHGYVSTSLQTYDFISETVTRKNLFHSAVYRQWGTTLSYKTVIKCV